MDLGLKSLDSSILVLELPSMGRIWFRDYQVREPLWIRSCRVKEVFDLTSVVPQFYVVLDILGLGLLSLKRLTCSGIVVDLKFRWVWVHFRFLFTLGCSRTFGTLVLRYLL